MTRTNAGRLLSWCVVLFAPGAVAALGACGDAAPVKTGEAPLAVEGIEHESCNPAGHKLESFDTRGDGKPVVIKVLDGTGHELCRVTDINHDGKPDLYEYFDGSGAVRRRESDYDGNGTVDSVEFYEGGKLVKREYDTTGQHRVDTWDYFDKNTGKRTRRERDTTNDGRVDQWWTWENGKITIAMDTNGDGKPDPSATLVLDDKGLDDKGDMKDAKSPPPAPAPPVAPPAASASSAPSLLDTAREAPAPSATPAKGGK